MAVLGLMITREYWQTEQFSAIKQFTFYSMILVFLYILLHMGKRLFWSRLRWWDYLYYIALLSLIAPVLWANSANEQFFHWLVDIGTLFFVIPIVLDLSVWGVKFKKHIL
jgi:hypothetical protein